VRSLGGQSRIKWQSIFGGIKERKKYRLARDTTRQGGFALADKEEAGKAGRPRGRGGGGGGPEEGERRHLVTREKVN